jgi:hypothetical protein
MATSVDKSYIDSIGVKVTLRIGKSVQSGDIPEDELAEVCDYALVAFESMTTGEELLDFLKKLSARWPVFTDIFQTEEKNLLTVSSIEQSFVQRNQI